MKNSFILYQDYQSHINLLTDEQAGKLFKAIFLYNQGHDVDLDPVTKMAFSFIKAHLERDKEKYQAIVERNKNNGLKGGRPKNSEEPKETHANPENPVGFLGTQNNPEEPKKADNDSDNDNDNDNDSEIEKKKIIKEKDSPMESHDVPSVPKGGKMEKPEDVSDGVWTDWLKMRKLKKALVTPRVVNGLRKEGEKIGWSLESVLEKCTQRNWTGFESAWVAKDMPRLQNNSSYFNNNTLQQGGGGVGYIPTKQEIVEKCKNGAWNDAEQLAPLIGHLRAMRLVAGTGHEKNDLQSLINSADQRLSELTGVAPF